MTEKKLKILMLAGRMEVGYSRDYAVLLGDKELTAERKRLAELVQDGYMDYSWRNGRKIYFLTQKGLNVIDSHMKKPFNPSGYATEHALYCAETAAYLHMKGNIDARDILFDREMEGLEGIKPERAFNKAGNVDRDDYHAPDLICGTVAYEIELTQKTTERLKRNVIRNATMFEKQVWFVPKRLKSLKTRLLETAEKTGCKLVVCDIEGVHDFLQTAELKENNIGARRPVKMKEMKNEKKNIMEELV